MTTRRLALVGFPAGGGNLFFYVFQRLLQRVLGVVQRAEHPVAVGVERRPAPLDEVAMGVLITRMGRVEQASLLELAHPDEFGALRR